MKRILKNGITSVILRFFLPDSASTTGAGKTALDHTAAGLIISTIASNEATPTVYTSTGSTVETITTLGTFAAPTATKCRFKKVDDTNHPGIYELQLADARFAVSNARNLLITILATGVAPVHAEIELVAYDPQDTVRLGLTGIPNAAAGANGGLPLGDASGRVDIGKLLGTAWLTPGVAGTPDVNAKQISADATAASRLAKHALGVLDVKLDASSPTAIILDATAGVNGAAPSAVDDFYQGVLVLTSGALAGQRMAIASYVGATRVLAVSPGFTGSPANDVVGVIV